MPTLSGDGVRVVLVGTGTHVKGSLLPDVAAVEGTVGALRDCLLDVCGVLKGNLVTLVDPPGPEPFLDEVLRAAASASDVLLIYYVGHGVLSTAGDLHLATHATVDLTSKAGFQALAYSELVAALVNCRARLVVVILDCCYSGRATNPVRSGAVLASADYNEQALAPVGEAYPAFSGQLLLALRDGVPSAPPQLTLQHLHDHLSRTMQRENRPRPVLQLGNQAGELVLATNRAYQPPGDEDEDVAAPWDGACPYRGLEPFTAKDERLFCGRDELVKHVLRRLGERVRNGGVTVVDGPSGSGKTSLLFAGVVPAIGHGDLGIAGSSSWPHVSLTPGEDPLGNLAAQLSQLGPGADPESIRAELATGPEQSRAAVRRAVSRAMGPGADVTGARLVLVVDQLEELFAPGVSDSARGEFVTAIDAVAARTEDADPPAVVIVGLRADFSGQCARFPELAAALEDNHIVVGPMTTAELRSAIVKPAEQAGLALQPGLVELVLRDTGADPDNDQSADYDPGALPLLSHALLRTWQHRRGNLLTVQGYRDIGGVTGAISTTAEHTFSTLEPASQEAARRLLPQMVLVGDGIPDTRRRVNLSDLPPAASAALEAFANSRLVTVDRDTAEITHEALIRSWPRLRDWMNEDRADRLITQEVETAAAAWQHSGRDTALLYRGSRLTTARPLTEAPHHSDLSTTALHFLTASTQQERRTTWLRRSAVAALVVLLLLASGAAVFAYRQRNTALAQRDTAISSRLLTSADTLGQTDQSLAAQLDVLAYHLHPSPDLRTRLLATQDTPLPKPLPGLTGYVSSMAFSPDGHTLATNSSKDPVRLWNVTDPAHPTPLGQPLTGSDTGPVGSVAFSPDGHTLASGGQDGTVRLWDMDVDSIINRICAAAGNDLPPAQWQLYVPELPPTPLCGP